jgi:hypothetical protein
MPLLAIFLIGCQSQDTFKPATRPVPPASEPPPIVWQAEFDKPQSLEGWDYTGPETNDDLIRSAEGMDKVFYPTLKAEEKCSLQLREPVKLEARHLYRLCLDLHLAPYARRRVSVIFGQPDKELSPGLLLLPVRHYGWVEPPPLWVTETAEFIAPADVRGVRFKLELEQAGDNREMSSAVRGLRLEDLGPIAMADEPSANLQMNPGLEIINPDNSVIGWPAEAMCRDKAAAHSGEACARMEGAGRTVLQLGGGFVDTPAIVRFSAWVRGSGTIYLECRRSGPAYQRLMGFGGPSFELTEEWREISWEVGLPDTVPETISFHFIADVRRKETCYLDDVDIRIISADGVRHY